MTAPRTVPLARQETRAENAASAVVDCQPGKSSAGGRVHFLRSVVTSTPWPRADAGDKTAAERLAELLYHRRDLDTLTVRADAGDQDAVGQLTRLLYERGDRDALAARVAAGDQGAVQYLATWLGLDADRVEAPLAPGGGSRGAASEIRDTACNHVLTFSGR